MKVKRFLSVLLVLSLLISGILITSINAHSISLNINPTSTQNRYYNFSNDFILAGDGAQDIVNVAQSQLGKTGSQLGYTEQWCADFVSDCAILANQSSAIPAAGYCPTLRQNIKNAGGVYVNAYNAKPGDIVFYGNDGADHVEIVYAASGGNVSTYGGNSGSGSNLYTRSVKQHSTQTQTIAYIIRPKYETPSGNNSQIDLTFYEGSSGYVHIEGYAYDPDRTDIAINVKVCIGSSETNYVETTITANKYMDLSPYGIASAGNYHGFSENFTLKERGQMNLYIEALDATGDGGGKIRKTDVFVQNTINTSGEGCTISCPYGGQKPGGIVPFRVSVNDGFVLLRENISVNGAEVYVDKDDSERYYFVMPENDVVIKVVATECLKINNCFSGAGYIHVDGYAFNPDNMNETVKVKLALGNSEYNFIEKCVVANKKIDLSSVGLGDDSDYGFSENLYIPERENMNLFAVAYDSEDKIISTKRITDLYLQYVINKSATNCKIECPYTGHYAGEKIPFTVIPDDGYEIIPEYVSALGVTVHEDKDVNNGYYFYMPHQDTEIIVKAIPVDGVDIFISKSIYDLDNPDETVSISVLAKSGVKYSISIDKEGVGRVITTDCNKKFFISASELGTGHYSAYFTVYTDTDLKNTKTVSFEISHRLNIGNDFYCRIKNSVANKYLTAINENVQGENISCNENQIWHFFRYDNNCYKIENVGNGKIMNVQNCAITGAGTNVLTYNSNDCNAQRFYIFEAFNSYYIKPLCADMVLDMNNITNNIEVWNSAANCNPQKFNIEFVNEADIGKHEVVIDKGYAPTYTETGLTDGSHCSVCGEILTRQEIILIKQLLIGDIDDDGVVSITDATDIQKYIAQLTELSDEQKAVADTNGDGEVNIIDATQIQKYIAQLIDKLG